MTNSNEGWISVSECLPDYDVKVLIYWQLPKDKKEGGYYDMIEIAHLESVTTRKDDITTTWTDKNYDNKTPTHWQPLPKPPIP